MKESRTSFSARVLIIVAMVALTGISALAQTAGAGTITGVLTDPSGAPVPGATVVITNKDTGIDRNTTSNDSGIYNAAFLQPGHYEINLSKTGFASILRKDLTLQVGQTMSMDFKFQVQTTSTTLTVTGEAPIVDTEKTDVSQVVSSGFVANLPIAGRRWESFVLLTPNVTNDGGSGLISYRGISGLYNSTAVDGANNSQSLFSETRGRASGVPYVYSQDSIMEFQVSTSNYSAEFGQAAGGITNAVTRSGTNTVHGDAFYYLRYPTWNALDPVAKAQGVKSQTIHQQQQFGASIGTALIKDKLFFFGTYDGSRKVNPVLYTSTVKYPLACASQIPVSLCTAANSFLSSQAGIQPRFANQDLGFGKLDYQLNEKNHISSSFNLVDFHSPNSYRANPTYSNESVSYNGANVTHERIFITNWDSTISSTIVNNLRFQWGRDLEITGANSGPPAVGIAGSPGGASLLTYGMPNALPRPAEPDEHRIQIADILSLTHGKHRIKLGFDGNYIHELMINLFQGGGIYAYQGAVSAAFGNWVADVAGIDLGDGLTGRHWSTFTQVNDPVTHVGKDDFWMQNLAGFAEDVWKVRNNLTVSLGVRYDVQLVPQPPRPVTLTPLLSYYTSKINIDKNNFAPRLGIAWQLGKGMVLRSGYGITYAQTPGSTYYAQRVENVNVQATYNCTPTTCPQLTFPNVPFAPPGPPMAAPFAGALTPKVANFTPPAGTTLNHGMVPDFVNPLVHQGDVTFEKELPMNMSFSASYVVSRALRLPIYVDANLAPATTTRSYDITNLSGATQSTITMPFYSTRLNPQTGVILAGFSDVNSWYNSMVLSVRKQMSHGFEFLANYTLARAIDGGQVAGQFGTFFGTDPPLDPLNRKAEYGSSDLDQRHRFVGSAVYAPRFSKISNKGLKYAVDGFNFSTIITASSGQPLTSNISGFPSGAPDGGVTGGLVTNSGGASGGRAPFVSRNNIYLPNLYNVDFRIGRDFRIVERLKFTVVGEAFNLFNHPLVTGIGPGSPPNVYNYTAAGSGVCAGHTNGCIVPNATYPTITQTTTAILGARQLQISARITF
jgi:hypothetical protein